MTTSTTTVLILILLLLLLLLLLRRLLLVYYCYIATSNVFICNQELEVERQNSRSSSRDIYPIRQSTSEDADVVVDGLSECLAVRQRDVVVCPRINDEVLDVVNKFTMLNQCRTPVLGRPCQRSQPLSTDRLNRHKQID